MHKTWTVLLAALCALLLGIGAVAEGDPAPAEEWVGVFDGAAAKDDKFLNAIEVSAGGYVAVGMSETDALDADGNSTYDAMIVKYAADGAEEWRALVPLTKFECVKETDAGYLAVGVTTSTAAPFEGRAEENGSDAAAVLFDKSGALVWAASVGGTGYDSFAVGDWMTTNDPVVLESGNYLIAGSTNSQDGDFADKATDDRDGFLAEFDPNGALVSKRMIASSSNDSLYTLVKLADGGFAVAGSSRGEWNAETETSDPVTLDGVFEGAEHSDWSEGYAFVIRYDKDFNTVWTKLIESHGPYNLMLAELSDGTFALGGDGFELNVGADVSSGLTLMKLDAAGTVLWAKEYTSGTSLYFTSLSVAANGTILLSGEDYYDSVIDEGSEGIRGWLGIADADGNLVASRTYGETDFEVLFHVRPASDGGVIAAGESASEKGDWNAVVVKYAPIAQ